MKKNESEEWGRKVKTEKKKEGEKMKMKRIKQRR